jgi:hypothetical protein
MANEKIIFDTEVKVGSSVGSVKSLKAELRAITNELGTLEQGSEAFVKAAKKAGELQDKIGDVKNTINAFNPEAKFQALAGAVGIAANGFAAMQGAMSLMGAESENLNKVIAQTQGAIALATGLNGLLGMKDAFDLLKLQAVTSFTAIKAAAVTTFTTIKGAMAATGIGALIVALGYLYTKFLETAAANEEATKKEKEYAEQTKKTKEATDEKVKSIELEIIAIKNKTNAAGATLIQAKAEKLALEEQIKLADEHNKQQKEAYTTAEIGGKIITISNLIETDSLKKKLVEKNKEIESLDLISKKTKELEDVKKSADAAEKQAAKNKSDLEYKKDFDKLKIEQQLKNVEEEKKILDIKRFNEEEDRKERERLSEEAFDAELKNIVAQGETLTSQYYKDKQAQIEIDKLAIEAKQQLLQTSASILGSLSELAGKQTAEGKTLAIAQATIDTYLSASSAYAAAAKIDPLILAPLAAGAAIVAGFARVKAIAEVQVPGASGSGGGGGAVAAPSAPRIPQSFSGSMINQNKPLSTTTVGGQVQKVIVTETDITKTQDKVKGIIRKATIK